MFQSLFRRPAFAPSVALGLMVSACAAKSPAPVAAPAAATAAPATFVLPPSAPVPVEKDLFDGKTTSGWKGYKRDTVPTGWQAVDGALTRVNKAGDLCTVEEYEFFDLTFEWKIESGGNSGVMFRVSENWNEPWRTGPEYQVQPPNGHDPEKAGSIYALYPAKEQLAHPPDQWNQSRLVVGPDQHGEAWLNGVKTAEFVVGSAAWNERVAATKFKDMPGFGKNAKGLICLQDHGSMVAYKNLHLKVLK